ncbi:hypothetical protein CHELA1G11_50065 [Hyphomicrobiales bacterium]|nr:hypothetical protein CHELA1G11_50065 [Hyphomicrobiales bacterium]
MEASPFVEPNVVRKRGEQVARQAGGIDLRKMRPHELTSDPLTLKIWVDGQERKIPVSLGVANAVKACEVGINPRMRDHASCPIIPGTSRRPDARSTASVGGCVSGGNHRARPRASASISATPSRRAYRIIAIRA